MKNNIIVIKIGGAVLEHDKLIKNIISNIKKLIKLKHKIVVVHGGSKQIDKEMIKANIPIKKIDGKRYTDIRTIEILNRCCKELNEKIVNFMQSKKVNAIGLHGCNNKLIYAVKNDKPHDLGLVGKMVKFCIKEFLSILNSHTIVISPLICGLDKKLYNVNADEVAEYVAVSLKANKLILITDVDGIYMNENGQQKVIHHLDISETKSLLNSNIISGGMIPKLKSCIKVVETGIKNIHIVNGNVKNILINTVSGKFTGTTISK